MANGSVLAEIQNDTTAAVSGTNTGDGPGVFGESNTGIGVSGKTTGGPQGFSGVFGESIGGAGVSGHSTNSVGVDARSDKGPAAMRAVGSDATNGVIGRSTGSGVGVFGQSDTGIGVSGKTTGGPQGFSGVFGESIGGAGVSGHSTNSVGVDARSDKGPAAMRAVGSDATNGVIGRSTGSGVGVSGESSSGKGVSAISTSGTGIFAKGAVNAGFFEGNVAVTGDITLVGGDCAEDFDLAGSECVEPGTVMVMNEDGALRQGWFPYDKCVAGVVCGAGDYRPGIILDRRDSGAKRIPVALLGKVACKVDAEYGSIEVGDLLTTSLTPGHAMKATDNGKAFGSVIGKALRSQRDGRGMIPVLVALQ